MSYPRLALVVLGLPLLAGGCAGSVAVAGASYGADGVSMVETGKTTTDHFASMVSKKDCALWRAFRNQRICYERDSDKDPYHVDYESAQRQPSEDGVVYAQPLRPASQTPPTSWTAQAYTPVAPAPPPAAAPPPAVVEEASPAPSPPAKPAVPKSAKKKPKAHAKAVRMPLPHQVASDP
jgi:hypothetical protein